MTRVKNACMFDVSGRAILVSMENDCQHESAWLAELLVRQRIPFSVEVSLCGMEVDVHVTPAGQPVPEAQTCPHWCGAPVRQGEAARRE